MYKGKGFIIGKKDVQIMANNKNSALIFSTVDTSVATESSILTDKNATIRNDYGKIVVCSVKLLYILNYRTF